MVRRSNSRIPQGFSDVSIQFRVGVLVSGLSFFAENFLKNVILAKLSLGSQLQILLKQAAPAAPSALIHMPRRRSPLPDDHLRLLRAVRVPRESPPQNH